MIDLIPMDEAIKVGIAWLSRYFGEKSSSTEWIENLHPLWEPDRCFLDLVLADLITKVAETL